MPNTKQNRKDFLKNAGLALGGLVTSGFTNSSGADIKFDDFSQAEKDFLLEYAGWLKEFAVLVEQQKEDREHPETQNLLMKLAAEIEERRTELENFMASENFAVYYMALTQKLSAKIE